MSAHFKPQYMPVGILTAACQEPLNMTALYRRDGWQVSVWGKNLNDDRAVYNGLTVFGQFSQLSPMEVGAGEPFISGVVSPGRSYGLAVRKIWGDY